MVGWSYETHWLQISATSMGRLVFYLPLSGFISSNPLSVGASVCGVEQRLREWVEVKKGGGV